MTFFIFSAGFLFGAGLILTIFEGLVSEANKRTDEAIKIAHELLTTIEEGRALND